MMSVNSQANDEISQNLKGSETKEGKFQNTDIRYETSLRQMYDISLQYFKVKRLAPQPLVELPVQSISKTDLENLNGPSLFRLGHSSILIHLDDEFFLTDPVFSDRASPVQWAGPKRFHKVPVSIDDLPPIKAVVISHDHYDHLDHQTVLDLADKTQAFITPLKVGKRLVEWGVPADKIIEKDWWESHTFGTVTLTATPSQHFSGRGLLDKDKTLWASWVIKGDQGNLFFSGDSGYFSGFKEIGERFGPFDITMIETGAYHPLWSEIHMLPEQSLQAHIDLKGKAMIPIHNCTFDLALHDWYEPMERIRELAHEEDVTLLTPVMGEKIDLNQIRPTYAWWKPFMPDNQQGELVIN